MTLAYQRPLPNYENFVDIAAILGLKGATRIVFEEVQRLLELGEKVSVMKVSVLTNYHYVTVWRTFCELRRLGLLNVDQPKRGGRTQYAIAFEV